MSEQTRFWNDWNTKHRELEQGDVSRRQEQIVMEWLRTLSRKDLKIIDVGCGSGWLCGKLEKFGSVTGTDLSDEVLARAGERMPLVNFVAGDFEELIFPLQSFDVVISLEVLSHVADQQLFINKLASLLKPGGHLMLATQNRWVLERNEVAPVAKGQLRNWVDTKTLRRLVSPNFAVQKLFSVTPRGHKGILRVVNSPKLNWAVTRLIHPTTLERFKEKIGCGWTLMLLAKKSAIS